MLHTPSKKELRELLRQDRRQLSSSFRQNASAQIVQSLLNLAIFQQAQRIAIYLPFDNETDISTLLKLAPQKRFYLPLITDSFELLFAHYAAGDALKPNRLGIQEPLRHQFCPAEALDLVCLPLVSFDARGNRLGTGAGYYDRTFAFKTQGSLTPCLLGIAFECQKVETIPADPWDVKVWGIQTEERLYQSI